MNSILEDGMKSNCVDVQVIEEAGEADAGVGSSHADDQRAE